VPFTEINGERIYYEDSGGDGPAVVFSHGFLLDHEMFAPQIDALSDSYRCISWDERGHGESTARKQFSYYDSASDLVALLDLLEVEQATLCGMSQGGFLSLRAALTSPQRVRALVLIDTQSGLEDPTMVPAYDAMRDEWLANGPANVKEAVAFAILGEGCDSAPWFAKWDELSRESLQQDYRCLVERDDISDRLGKIPCPAVVIHGSADVSIPLAKAEQLSDGLSGSIGVVVVDGAPHASNLSHPDIVNKALREFLDAHAG
jgi:pimeloyl-ACP methyl ester carboxylesterase